MIEVYYQKILKNIKKHVPEKLRNKYLKNLENVKKTWKKQKTLLLPLNHTKSSDIGGWIEAVQIYETGIPNNFNIRWIFNRKYNKPDIISTNKSYKFIKELLETNSAGQFYINNVSFGWKFKNLWGSHLKNNPFFKMFNPLSHLQGIIPFVDSISRLYRSFKALNPEKAKMKNLLNEWDIKKSYTWLTSMFKGAFLGVNIPQKEIFKKVVGTINSGNTRYLTGYGARKFKKAANKYHMHNFNKKAKKIKW